MFREVSLMPHVLFGVLGTMASVWLFVEVLNANEGNRRRMRWVSLIAAAFMWLAYLLGGYWYVTQYGADKAIIQAGPWPWAHAFSMEVKEHLFLTLLLLSTYLPIAVFDSDLVNSKGARRLVLAAAVLTVLLGLSMDGFGALTSMGVRMGLL